MCVYTRPRCVSSFFSSFTKRRWLEKSFAAVEARRQPLPTSWHGAPSPLTVHVTLLAPSMPRILTNVGTFSLTNRGIVCVSVCCVSALGRGGSGRPAAHNTWFAVFRWPTSNTSLSFRGRRRRCSYIKSQVWIPGEEELSLDSWGVGNKALK